MALTFSEQTPKISLQNAISGMGVAPASSGSSTGMLDFNLNPLQSTLSSPSILDIGMKPLGLSSLGFKGSGNDTNFSFGNLGLNSPQSPLGFGGDYASNEVMDVSTLGSYGDSSPLDRELDMAIAQEKMLDGMKGVTGGDNPSSGFNFGSLKDWGTGLSALGSLYGAYNQGKYVKNLERGLDQNREQFTANFNEQKAASDRQIAARNDALRSARPSGYV